MEVYASWVSYRSPDLDDVLRAVADERRAEIIIGPDDLCWLYHPYDGGADVIASTTAQREQLTTDFAAWLPPLDDALYLSDATKRPPSARSVRARLRDCAARTPDRR